MKAAPPAAVSTAPVPAPVAEPALPFWELIRIYGTFKPTVIFSSDAVESYSQPNASAITAAANPVLAVAPTAERLTFQVAQSRLGFQFNEKGAIRGHFEIDFIDFSKASPTVASLPRLRIANIDWVATPWFTLSAGQDWDLHAPLNPHGANLVGAQFLSGNSGFMRDQVKGFFKVGEVELAAAAGFASPNITAKDGSLEFGLLPTFAVRATWMPKAGDRVGVSGIATQLNFGAGTATSRKAFAGEATLFGEMTLGTSTNVRAELSIGQNAANLGLLTLGFGGVANDVPEWGGFISVRHGFTANHFVYGHAGLARGLNMALIRPSYSTPTGATAPALAGTGPGIRSNVSATIGYELRVHKMLAFMLEGFYFRTEHALTEADRDAFASLRTAFGAELAAMVTF